jgi:hypothetical protein
MASAKVQITRNFTSLADLALTTADDMREIGLLAREQFVRRTRQAQGPDGPLEPLSEDYAKQKREALGTAVPDLTVSGNMLNDLQVVEVDDDSVTLGWLK